jgi:hypothetical protein
LRSDVVDVLLDNGSFYRESPKDDALHLVDAEAIGKLAYLLVQYAANIFGATLPILVAGKWAYKKYFADSLPITATGSGGAQSKDLEPKVLSDTDLRVRLVNLKTNLQNEKLRAELTNDFRRILEFHGWPTNEARGDASKTLEALLAHESTGSE